MIFAMAASKSREKRELPGNVQEFNAGLAQIFEKRNLPFEKSAEWLIPRRDLRRIASAYILALEYCGDAMVGGKKEVADAARRKGNEIAGQIEVFLANAEVKRKSGGWAKLEEAREGYLKARKKGAVPVKKGGKTEEPEFTKAREAGGEQAGKGIKGAKISKAEPSKEELEAKIAKLNEEIGEAERQYDSIRSQKEEALEKMEEEESGWFTSREEVKNSPEYTKLKEEWGEKEDVAWQRWTRTKERGTKKIRALEDKIEALYWTKEQRMRKIGEYVEETLDPIPAEYAGGKNMVSSLRGLTGGWLSRGIVGCGNQKEREELDKYLLLRLEDGARELSTHEGLSNPIGPFVRAASAEAIGMIRPNDEWVNRRLVAQLGKHEKSDIVKGDIAIAVGRIAEKHKNTKIDSGGKLRDEATDILLGILAKGEESSSKNVYKLSFRKRMFANSVIALGKTAKGTGREREAVDALAKVAVDSPTPMVSVAAAASISRIGGRYAKKKLEEVREKKGLPEVARIIEIADAYENGNVEYVEGMDGGIMNPNADFSKFVPPGKTRREMVFEIPSKR
jgi:hypothetical protein